MPSRIVRLGPLVERPFRTFRWTRLADDAGKTRRVGSTPALTRDMPRSMVAKSVPFVLVVGHGPQLEQDDGAAAMLRQLGAQVRTMDLWDDFSHVIDLDEDGVLARAMVFEAGGRPDLSITALRAARKTPELTEIPAILAVSPRQVAGVEPSCGFDDFIVSPCVPAELYARIRALEWRRSEFSTEERFKIGNLVIDRAAHEVVLDGRRIVLTAKEFSLLAFLAANRGRVFNRDVLLTRVWGSRYEGGPRTVDIHVRRLRAKLGDALPLETLRGAGYKLRAPTEQAPARPKDDRSRNSSRLGSTDSTGQSNQ
ncbi:MAG: response regulator transcription factor [Myxococcales bacterium]